MKMTAVSGGWLAEKVASGGVLARVARDYTSDYAKDASTGYGANTWLPARLMTGNDAHTGFVNLTTSDLTDGWESYATSDDGSAVYLEKGFALMTLLLPN